MSTDDPNAYRHHGGSATRADIKDDDLGQFLDEISKPVPDERRPNDGKLVRFKSHFPNRKNKYQHGAPVKFDSWGSKLYGSWNFYQFESKGSIVIQGRAKGMRPMVLQCDPEHIKECTQVIIRRIGKGMAQPDNGFTYKTKYGQLDFIRAVSTANEMVDPALITARLEQYEDEVAYVQFWLHEGGIKLSMDAACVIWTVISGDDQWIDIDMPADRRFFDQFVDRVKVVAEAKEVEDAEV